MYESYKKQGYLFFQLRSYVFLAFIESQGHQDKIFHSSTSDPSLPNGKIIVEM